MEDLVQVGTIVKCIKRVAFINGEVHRKGDMLTVPANGLAYYRLYIGKDYTLVEEE